MAKERSRSRKPAPAPPKGPPVAARARRGATSAKRGPRVKPAKPYPGFPLFPHATGRWAKKIRGKFAFFGPWEDPQGALQRFLDERDELMAGRVPRGKTGESGKRAKETPTLRELVNRFLDAKHRRLESGEMGQRAFADYHASSGRLLKGLDEHRRLDDIDSADLGGLRAKLAVTMGPVSLGNEIGRVRSIFKFAFESGLIPAPLRFGAEFAKPGKRTIRLARHARGPRMFEPPEIKILLEAATPQMKAMILLGLNCGLGNTDIAMLPKKAFDLKKGLMNFPRPKTGIARRAVLWPETVAALKQVAKVRPAAKREEDDGLVFMTKYGRPWLSIDPPKPGSGSPRTAVVKDAIGLQFGKLMRATGTHVMGRSFYALRHTFRTVADEVGDRPAVDLIMGHENGQDIATHYIERIGDPRLKRVTDAVKAWLNG